MHSLQTAEDELLFVFEHIFENSTFIVVRIGNFLSDVCKLL